MKKFLSYFFVSIIMLGAGFLISYLLFNNKNVTVENDKVDKVEKKGSDNVEVKSVDIYSEEVYDALEMIGYYKQFCGDAEISAYFRNSKVTPKNIDQSFVYLFEMCPSIEQGHLYNGCF